MPVHDFHKFLRTIPVPPHIGPPPPPDRHAPPVGETAKKRMVAKLHAIKAELRRRMHEPVADVGAWLQRL
jgi:hypothetical protein